jgi:hypothetical protein
MGYTHYLKHTQPFSDEEWSQINDALSKIIHHASIRGITTATGDGRTAIDSSHSMIEKPWIQNWGQEGPVIAINGLENQMCETFVIYKNGTPKQDWQSPGFEGFSFCKTQRLPYDAVVTATIIWIDSHFPGRLNASSDGDSSDWREGMNLAKIAFPDDKTLAVPKGLDD